MNATSRPRETETRWKAPNSSRQGAHQEAHLLITTGVPRSDARRARSAGRPPPSSSLACVCRLASAGGEPVRPARICASVSVDGVLVGGALSWSSPTTSSAPTAAVASASDRRLSVIA